MKKKFIIKYPALFEVNSDGISISFPDVPECLSCAYNKRQSFKMAKEALELALHGTIVCELPTQNYPVKKYSSKTFYIREITAKFDIEDKCLKAKNVKEVEVCDSSFIDS